MPADRKDDILKATFQALKENGLPMLSYDVIAQQGDISRQLIRYHFKDPEELMIELCDYLAGRYRDAMISEVMKLQGAERLKTFLDFYFDLLADNPKPRDDQVYDALMSLSASSDRVRTNLRNQYSLLGQVLSHEFELEYPRIGTQGAQELSFLFVSLMYGHWKMVASLGLSEDHNAVTRNAMDRLLASYLSSGDDSLTSARIWQKPA